VPEKEKVRVLRIEINVAVPHGGLARVLLGHIFEGNLTKFASHKVLW